ncbi:MAG: cobalamin B12-binding domain-containing protein [Deltaproteobacteria bacterium]|nr:cobalamin B12-binding domain-containing protein [Deltaproteobacteria bacterium]
MDKEPSLAAGQDKFLCDPDQISSDQGHFFATYKPSHPLRFVTATALFDGHDASINIIRRLLQSRGVEVIHLGHNRSAKEVANAALQEDVHGVAVSSYQGGHMEYFRYLRELLDNGSGQDTILFGGGGGVVTPEEALLLAKEKIAMIYSPELGQKIGLEGMVGHMLWLAEHERSSREALASEDKQHVLSRALTLLENHILSYDEIISSPAAKWLNKSATCPVLGITGTGGAGKSSLLDELLLRFIMDFPEIRIGLICVDPSRKKTGGALLGDRIRINSCSYENIFLRSMASRESGLELSRMTKESTRILQQAGFDFLIVETSGIGQGNSGILNISDLSVYVMTPEYGASTQLEKIEMLDYADLIAVNKYDRRQGPDAVRDICTTLRRSRYKGQEPDHGHYPVYGTIASRFNDEGTNGLYKALLEHLKNKGVRFPEKKYGQRHSSKVSSGRDVLIPSGRENYLSVITQHIRKYHKNCNDQVNLAQNLESLHLTEQMFMQDKNKDTQTILQNINEKKEEIRSALSPESSCLLNQWKEREEAYRSEFFSYHVRGKEIQAKTQFRTLARQLLPKIALPAFRSQADLLDFLLRENLPGYFPFTGGLFPFRRTEEDPKRQFAGEGGPSKTNKRFHYLSKNDSAKRLSTAFDSVTLYGSDPHTRPDIYGKIGESGVSIAHLDDMKDLYAGFDLCHPSTSVSMTINGPAPIILAMFLNTAIDQQLDLFSRKEGREASPEEYHEIKSKTLREVRGTVQADILKEDQAQNTCIFSTEFALKMMGDIQEYFIENSVKNYYGVSVSGYHIAEAGANPISQLAFTLANGFTYVEYYLHRGFHIDQFAPNLSFFFSNGIDAEYSVLGRVARRIWSVAMRDVYGADERSQKLKYHIQTSGRSLHAQEMSFNDIRTTLQALMALYDNCNSLHTNAYDEALTTPTEESVRRAMAIQMIINREYGPNQCENINQGSFFIRELTDLVEEAVLNEFENISSRGGVLGAMETQYQRSKIQEESMYYEHLKHEGKIPIIGVNTFQNPDSKQNSREGSELVRSTYEEKDEQIKRLDTFKKKHAQSSEKALSKLRETAVSDGNIFAELMNTVRFCSLGEISQTLYRCGGRYRRSL